MKIESFETKYSVGDIVYTIVDRCIHKCMINEVCINIRSKSNGIYLKDIIKNPTSEHKEMSVGYRVVFVNEDCTDAMPSDIKYLLGEKDIDATLEGLAKKCLTTFVYHPNPCE